MRLSTRHLLGIKDLTTDDISIILDTAKEFKEVLQRPIKKVPSLRDVTIVNLFYENSTRTRISFELAEKRLSADTINFSSSGSSVSKGETLLDTVNNILSMKVDMVVMRHSASGAPHFLAKHIPAAIVNAGDGINEHPTQALLDAFTLKEVFPDLTGKKVLIIGDILHSRVARSTSTILKRLGVQVAYLGPGSLVPKCGPENTTRFTDYAEAMKWKPDVVYLLRVQMERQDVQYFPSLREYHKVYGVTEERLKRIDGEGLYLMHPGPVNRGVELCDGAMDYSRSLINRQVENGIAVRMAVLYWLKPAEE